MSITLETLAVQPYWHSDNQARTVL